MSKQHKKWIKYRHKVVTRILKLTYLPLLKRKYNITVEKCSEKKERQYLILYNHQTAADQFFVGMAFKQPIYYVASEDLFSNGFVSSLLRWLVAPIPIKKQSTDIRAVINCMAVANEGGSIAIAAEGNRTYSGKTEYINPAIAPLAKKLKLPILIFHIKGGFGTLPRWADNIRRGKMECRIASIIEPEEYKSISDDELYKRISDELYINEGVVDSEYPDKRAAEYIERAIYYCPYCRLSEFESHGDVIECKKCRKKVKYLPTKELLGIGFEFPYRFITDWYDAQSNYVNSIDPRDFGDTPIYTESTGFYEVIPYKNKQLIIENAEISLYGNKITINTGNDIFTFPFDDTRAVTVLGNNKVNIYFADKIYQIKGSKRLNAVKYVNIFNRYKNIVKGNENVRFLGL